MNTTKLCDQYLNYCAKRKELNYKTLRAYQSDLKDFFLFIDQSRTDILNKQCIENYIDILHCTKAPRTVKRKISSLRAFYHYLMCREEITENPLERMDLTFKLPQQLPRYIPTHIMEKFYEELYHRKKIAKSLYQKKCAIRDIAVIELLFSTGLRISELCNLKLESVNLNDGQILIYGKGNKERLIQLTEDITIQALKEYTFVFCQEICHSGYFFVNRLGNGLSPQSVRNMIDQIAKNAAISLHITPHMFRHSFATYLVNQDVDIRCIQEILGHSSIKTTEIYTHVDLSKQKKVLELKNPRKIIRATTN